MVNKVCWRSLWTLGWKTPNSTIWHCQVLLTYGPSVGLYLDCHFESKAKANTTRSWLWLKPGRTEEICNVVIWLMWLKVSRLPKSKCHYASFQTWQIESNRKGCDNNCNARMIPVEERPQKTSRPWLMCRRGSLVQMNCLSFRGLGEVPNLGSPPFLVPEPFVLCPRRHSQQKLSIRKETPLELPDFLTCQK